MAAAVSVLVPFRPDGGARCEAWEWLRTWWSQAHPDWQLVEGRCPDGDWVKAQAVADALSRADGDLLVIADADVLCDGYREAVRAVEAGAPWAAPHQDVWRLTADATRAVFGGGVPQVVARRVGALVRPAYRGVLGGGAIVLPRDAYRSVPLDPRFSGWNNEDISWAQAARALLGKPWRSPWQPLIHFWHPPAKRLNAHVGDAAGHALHMRYRYAARDQAVMRRLINEIEVACGDGIG